MQYQEWSGGDKNKYKNDDKRSGRKFKGIKPNGRIVKWSEVR